MNTTLLLQRSQRITQQCLDLLFPPRCAGCRKGGHVLCPACLQAIPPVLPPFCQHCGSPSASNGMCQSCRYHQPRLHGLRAASIFQEPLRSYIHALKYDGKTRLAEPLGRLLAQAYTRYFQYPQTGRESPLLQVLPRRTPERKGKDTHQIQKSQMAMRYGFQVDAMISVPLHPERQKQRGYNHAELLAEVCASLVGVPLYNDIVQRQKATPAQVGLSASQRYQNMAGAFTCAPTLAAGALRGRRILIIDDVCTTGATLEACAAPLYAAGASAVWGLVLARPM